jgi:hypothetical protein
VRPEGLGQFKKNPPHQDLNLRPFGLQLSALTTTLLGCVCRNEICVIREFLTMHFPGRWIGRDEPIASSPSLPLDDLPVGVR